MGPAQPHGMPRFSWKVQLGTGQRSAGQSAGCVVRVTVGHVGVGVGVVLGGSVVTLMMTVRDVLLDVVGASEVVDVRRVRVRRRVELLVVVVVRLRVVGVRVGGAGVVVVVDVVVVDTRQGRFWDLNSTPQPLYGHAALHGASSVAVGIDAGHPHGLSMVVTNMQLAFWHDRACVHCGAIISDVMVGQSMSMAANSDAATRLRSNLSQMAWPHAVSTDTEQS